MPWWYPESGWLDSVGATTSTTLSNVYQISDKADRDIGCTFLSIRVINHNFNKKKIER